MLGEDGNYFYIFIFSLCTPWMDRLPYAPHDLQRAAQLDGRQQHQHCVCCPMEEWSPFSAQEQQGLVRTGLINNP